MSEIIVTSKECLVVCVNEPERVYPYATNIKVLGSGWYGVLESKSQDWTIDQIAAHCGKAEHVVRILKIGEYGAVEDITDAVLDYMEQEQ